MNPTKYIWKNNEFLKWEDATTHVLTHSMHYSTAVFEGIRAYQTDQGPAIFRGMDHYNRLEESANLYHLKSPYTPQQLLDATTELISRNDLKSCYIRPIIYTGYGSMGILPRDCPIDTVIATWEWGTYLGEEGLENGIRTTISPYHKFHSKAMPSTAKCVGNYANSYLAKHDAKARGFDEAILLNQSGHISEGPGENLFLIKAGHVSTPPVTEDILEGITRHTLITLIIQKGYQISYKPITLDELIHADELFFTGTAAEVTPIREIDGNVIGNGSRGPITTELQAAYFDIVNGRNEEYQDWLTVVPTNAVTPQK